MHKLHRLGARRQNDDAFVEVPRKRIIESRPHDEARAQYRNDGIRALAPVRGYHGLDYPFCFAVGEVVVAAQIAFLRKRAVVIGMKSVRSRRACVQYPPHAVRQRFVKNDASAVDIDILHTRRIVNRGEDEGRMHHSIDAMLS